MFELVHNSLQRCMLQCSHLVRSQSICCYGTLARWLAKHDGRVRSQQVMIRWAPNLDHLGEPDRGGTQSYSVQLLVQRRQHNSRKMTQWAKQTNSEVVLQDDAPGATFWCHSGFQDYCPTFHVPSAAAAGGVLEVQNDRCGFTDSESELLTQGATPEV
jgi:hypothetical protein